MQTPILLICFNRPQHTYRVLERIMERKPKDLYVFHDHWRENRAGEEEACAKVKVVVEELVQTSPETKLHYYTPEHNLGCGPGPMTGLNWFFSENEMGIVLEDDAIPHPDFFGYCEALLEKYKDDKDVRAIGSMHLDDRTYGDGSYYFSMMNRTLCAWATWARAWRDMDFYLDHVSGLVLNNRLREYGCDRTMRKYWCERVDDIKQQNYWYKSWDMQFWMSIWMHHSKGIMPNVNLSTNIGFDGSGVHCPVGGSVAANRPTASILPLVHPTSSRICLNADLRFQRFYFDPLNYGWPAIKRIPVRLNKWLKRLVGHQGSWFGKSG